MTERRPTDPVFDPAGTPPGTHWRQQLHAGRLDLLYARRTGPWIAMLAGAVALYPLLRTIVPTEPLMAWLATATLLGAFRFILVYRYWRAERPRDLAMWYRRFNGATLCAGLTWGAGALLVARFSGFTEHVFLVFALWGLGAAALSAMAASYRSFLLFLIPAFIPISAWFYLQEHTTYLALGTMNLLFAGLLALAARHIDRTLHRSFQLGIENTDLISRLAAARQQSEHARMQVESTNTALAGEVQERKRAENQIRASERQLSSIFHNMQDVVYRTDTAGHIAWTTPSVLQLLGFPPAEFTGLAFSTLYANPADETRMADELGRGFGVLENFEVALKTKTDARIWASINAHFYHAPDGSIAGIEGIIRDVTILRYAQESLHQEKEKIQVTLESIGDGVITTDVKGVVEYLNPRSEQLTGWRLREARGLPLEKVLCLVDEVTRRPAPDPVGKCLQENRTVGLPGNTALLHRQQEQEYSIEVTTAPIRDLASQVIGAVVALHDVTKLRGLARQMSHQATHDALTGLINRREFEARVKNALTTARNDGKHHALCYMDLDQFKVVNDTCGHGAGDELLKQITALFGEKIRESDTIARLGGDEFGALLEGCTLANAQKVAEDLRKTIEAFRFPWKGKTFRVGVSIGLVPVDSSSGTLSDVLSAADSACYVAKDQGRNRVHLYQPDDTAVAQRQGEMQWLQRIQLALDENRFRLYYQPILGISKQSVVGNHCELLLRMLGAKGEVIPPHAFIPAAERYHLMPAVDRWVVRTAVAALARNTGALKGMSTCAINLSGQSLSDETFLKFVVEELEGAGIDARRISFEITETAVIANLSSATHFIAVLKEMGCRFALDDFGSGLSSFAYLKNLSVDCLKLDGSYVKNLVHDATDRAMVKAINHVAHVMGIQTTAEFVESEGILKALRMFKVDYAQGYHIGKPQPLDSVLLEAPPFQAIQQA
ncbi:MAG: EAL domain-containing protein [Gammaproteobacteria bacterium]